MDYDYNQAWESTYGDIQQFGPTHTHLHRIYSSILRQIEYKSVLDVGCGPGLNFPLLLQGKNIEKVAGIDISSKAINLAKERYDGEFVVLDIQKEHLMNKFDLVLCSLLMEHVPEDEAVLKNLHEMARHYLLIGTMAGNYEKFKRAEEVVGHVRNYSPGELEAKLGKAGFTVKKCIKWGFPFYSPLTRLLLNINPKVSVGKYSTALKIVTTLLYWLYFLNSSKRGDVLTILAEV